MKTIIPIRTSSNARFLILSLVFLALIGLVDYVSGPQVGTVMLYVLPVVIASIGSGWWAGVGIALLGNIIGLLVALLTTPGGSPLILYVNALLYLGIELVLAYGLSHLRAAQEAREEMLQFVAHDFRTPLGNILIGLDILHIQPALQSDPALRQLVEMCQSSAQRLLHLSNSMLDLARLENGQFKVELQAVSVDEVLQDVLKQMTLWAEQAHITLQVEQEAQASQVIADAMLLNRILINLVGNAIKFSRPESTVTLRVQREEERIRFSVSDQGTGIPPHLVARVFDRFYQVQARRAGQATGSGLGLTFCRAAVLAQRGAIAVESEVGRGTTITFTLPAPQDEIIEKG